MRGCRTERRAPEVSAGGSAAPRRGGLLSGTPLPAVPLREADRPAARCRTAGRVAPLPLPPAHPPPAAATASPGVGRAAGTSAVRRHHPVPDPSFFVPVSPPAVRRLFPAWGACVRKGGSRRGIRSLGTGARPDRLRLGWGGGRAPRLFPAWGAVAAQPAASLPGAVACRPQTLPGARFPPAPERGRLSGGSRERVCCRLSKIHSFAALPAPGSERGAERDVCLGIAAVRGRWTDDEPVTMTAVPPERPLNKLE